MFNRFWRRPRPCVRQRRGDHPGMGVEAIGIHLAPQLAAGGRGFLGGDARFAIVPTHSYDSSVDGGPMLPTKNLCPTGEAPCPVRKWAPAFAGETKEGT